MTDPADRLLLRARDARRADGKPERDRTGRAFKEIAAAEPAAPEAAAVAPVVAAVLFSDRQLFMKVLR